MLYGFVVLVVRLHSTVVTLQLILLFFSSQLLHGSLVVVVLLHSTVVTLQLVMFFSSQLLYDSLVLVVLLHIYCCCLTTRYVVPFFYLLLIKLFITHGPAHLSTFVNVIFITRCYIAILMPF